MEGEGARKISPLKSSPKRSYSNLCISTKVVYIGFGKGSGNNEHTNQSESFFAR
jgi:hypothetical protein